MNSRDLLINRDNGLNYYKPKQIKCLKFIHFPVKMNGNNFKIKIIIRFILKERQKIIYKYKGEMFYVRGEDDIQGGIDEIVKFETDITKIHLYDELLLKVDMIESFGDYRILYMRYKGQ